MVVCYILYFNFMLFLFWSDLCGVIIYIKLSISVLMGFLKWKDVLVRFLGLGLLVI